MPIPPILLLLLVLAAIFAIAVLSAIADRAIRHKLLGSFQRPGQVQYSYESCGNLLTPAERSFFGVLEQAISEDHRLFAKVRLADIIRASQSGSHSANRSAFNKISAKHVDFVLCDRESLKVLAVIELDDKSHQRFDRGFRDSFVDSAFASAGIPLIRFPARASYSFRNLSEKLASAVANPNC